MKTCRRHAIECAAAATVLMTAACGTPDGPAIESVPAALAPPPAGLGRIYFYRMANPLLAMVTPEVVVNGVQVGVLHPGEVFYRDAEPGRYEALVDTTAEHGVDFRLKAGTRRFVRVAPSWDVLGWNLSAELTPRVEAEGDLRGLAVTDGFHSDSNANSDREEVE
jgi:hypothetical protein